MSAQGKGGCGCGGGGTGGGCGCGGSCGCGCGPKNGAGCTPGTFERPLFFGGQLLTEDDLEDLVEYVVAKNRLHNRMLFGDGVVCGLQVLCDPCGGAKITVRPGYALDCCGNDIAVDCPVTLDINQMIRDLRKRLLGKDCGDPCKDAKDDCSPEKPDPTSKVIEVTPKPLYARLGEGCQDKDTKTPRKHVEEYCLYVKYCETNAEPVAPYATDDCSPSSCKPTRIREGYEFELRCKTVEKPPRTIIDTFRDCLGDLKELRSSAAQAALMHRTFDAVAIAGQRVLTNQPIEFTPEDRVALEHASEELQKRIGQKAPSEAAIVDGIHTLIEVGALLARQHLGQAEETKKSKRALAPAPMIREAVTHYQSLLDRIEQPFARVLAQEAIAFFETPPDKLDPVQLRTLANGAMLTQPILMAAADPARQLHAVLRERATQQRLSHCNHRERAYQLPPPRYEYGELELSHAVAFSRTVSELALLLYEFDFGCFCDALNPPCADCDDPAVLLACLEWKDCKVTDICNIERKWVITWPNVRYWIPWIGELGEVWEQLCCADPCDRRSRGTHVSMLERMFAPRIAPDVHEVVRMLGRIPAHPATYLAPPPVAAPAAPSAPVEWKAALEDMTARLEKVQAHNDELAARLDRYESRKK
jgi:hypothetical protein